MTDEVDLNLVLPHFISTYSAKNMQYITFSMFKTKRGSVSVHQTKNCEPGDDPKI